MTDEMEEGSAPEESLLPEGVEEDLKTKHGKLLVFDAGVLGVFAFRRASQAINDRLIDKMTDDKSSKSAAIREYAASCLCYPTSANGRPDWKKASELFAEIPDLPQELLGDIKDLALRVDIKKR